MNYYPSDLTHRSLNMLLDWNQTCWRKSQYCLKNSRDQLLNLNIEAWDLYLRLLEQKLVPWAFQNSWKKNPLLSVRSIFGKLVKKKIHKQIQGLNFMRINKIHWAARTNNFFAYHSVQQSMMCLLSKERLFSNRDISYF